MALRAMVPTFIGNLLSIDSHNTTNNVSKIISQRNIIKMNYLLHFASDVANHFIIKLSQRSDSIKPLSSALEIKAGWG